MRKHLSIAIRSFLLVFSIVHASCASDNMNAEPSQGALGCPDTYIEAEDWTAIDNQEPPGRSFYVTGKVVVPTAGYSVQLTKRTPQGINPAILLLDLTVTRPSGVAAQVITTEEPRYEEKTYSGTYKSVEIYCGSNKIASPTIKVVH